MQVFLIGYDAVHRLQIEPFSSTSINPLQASVSDAKIKITKANVKRKWENFQ